MSERYSRLFSLTENLYTAGSPVVIAAGALLKDNQTGKLLAQLKLRSISGKTIKAATVLVSPLDTVGKPLGEPVAYQYLDLHADRDGDFGQKAPIALPDAATRSFTVSVTEVIFADNSIWNGTGSAWKPLNRPKSLDTLSDGELAKQFRIEYGSGCDNLLLEQEDLWHCVCGALNHREESCCHKCGKALAELQAIDMEEFRKKKDERVAKEQQLAKEQAKKDAELEIEKEQRRHKFTTIGSVIAVVCLLVFFWLTDVFIPSSHYKKAEQFLAEGEKARAAIEYGKAGNYSDARERSFELWADVTQRDVIAVDDFFVVALKNDGTVIASQGIKDKEYHSEGQWYVNYWSDIVAVSTGYENTIGLKSDGTVNACGSNAYGRNNVSNWKNVVAVSAGSLHTVALRADGTVMAIGRNDEGQCDVSDWKDIIAIAAGRYHTVGLKADGTVVAVGKWSSGQLRTSEWQDIVYIAAGTNVTAGIKSDGTVIATGECNEEVQDWTEVVQIACSNSIFGVTKSGDVMKGTYTYSGGKYHDAVAVACGGWGDIAIVRADGTVYSDGGVYGVASFDSWSNIKTP